MNLSSCCLSRPAPAGRGAGESTVPGNYFTRFFRFWLTPVNHADSS
jgi:hypothetical protein